MSRIVFLTVSLCIISKESCFGNCAIFRQKFETSEGNTVPDIYSEQLYPVNSCKSSRLLHRAHKLEELKNKDLNANQDTAKDFDDYNLYFDRYDNLYEKADSINDMDKIINLNKLGIKINEDDFDYIFDYYADEVGNKNLLYYIVHEMNNDNYILIDSIHLLDD